MLNYTEYHRLLLFEKKLLIIGQRSTLQFKGVELY